MKAIPSPAASRSRERALTRAAWQVSSSAAGVSSRRRSGRWPSGSLIKGKCRRRAFISTCCLIEYLPGHSRYQVFLGNNRGVFDMGHREYSRSDPRFWGEGCSLLCFTSPLLRGLTEAVVLDYFRLDHSRARGIRSPRDDRSRLQGHWVLQGGKEPRPRFAVSTWEAHGFFVICGVELRRLG